MGYWNKSYAIKDLICSLSTAWKPQSHSDDLFISGAEVYQPMLCGYPRKFSSTRCIYLHMLVMVSNCIKMFHTFLTVQVVSELLILQNHRIRMKSAQNSITFHVYTSQCIRYVVFYSSFECLSIEERSLGHRGVDGCLNSNCIKATTVNIFCQSA